MLATIDFAALPVLVFGVAALVWNRRLSHAWRVSQEAFAEALGVRWLQRVTRLINKTGFSRAFLVVWALLATLIGAVAFLGLGHTHHHH